MLPTIPGPQRRDSPPTMSTADVREFVGGTCHLRDLEDACELDVELHAPEDIEDVDVTWNSLDTLALWAKRASMGWNFVASWKLRPTLDGARATCRRNADRAIVSIPRNAPPRIPWIAPRVAHGEPERDEPRRCNGDRGAAVGRGVTSARSYRERSDEHVRDRSGRGITALVLLRI
jgi:hypothetical protein